MVSPSKTKHSRVAANQQQQRTASTHKVKLVKGPRPLVHHRFYLDVQKHQLASKIEYTIKELGGHVEFFLNKEITHFITDKDDCHHPTQLPPGQQPQADFLDSGPSSYQQPVTPKTPLSHLQHVSEPQPSSPCVNIPHAAATPATPGQQPTSAASNGIPSVGNSVVPPASPAASAASESKSTRPTQPRSRADAMLQRVRQQQQNQHSPSSSHQLLLARSTFPGSPCSPAAPQSPATPAPVVAAAAVANGGVIAAASNVLRLDRGSQSPAQLAKSWGKPIWSTDYTIRFLKKVILSCKQDQQEAIVRAAAATPKGRLHIQHFRGDFVKIESYQRQHRPAFLLFKKWPTLNLNNKANESPFDSDERFPASTGTGSKKQPAQQQKQQQQEDEVHVLDEKQETVLNQCGYCEICRIEYDVLANHLNSNEHRGFAGDDKNYETVDKLINEGGVSLGTFLSANQELADEELQQQVERTEQAQKHDVPSENCAEDTTQKIVGEEECEKESALPQETEPEEKNTVEEDAPNREEAPIPIKTYARKSKAKHTSNPAADPDPGSSISRPQSAKRTYAGRKSAAALAATVRPVSPGLVAGRTVQVTPIPEEAAASSQMFGRRSAIHHHPHNTLNHHNHQKAKAARQAAAAAAASSSSSSLFAAEQQQHHHHQREQKENKQDVPVDSAERVQVKLEVEEEHNQHREEETHQAEASGAMKLHNDSGTAANEKEKDRQSKRSAADRMGLKGSTIKPVHQAELMECEGLDPKNTKRISLGLRQNPKRANLNEDFTSLLDETLGPMRKPRVRRESAKRVNYSEPREDEIASQELIESILLEGTAKEVNENHSKKKAGSPKRASDVKIRGIRWRAPSPQSRPPVKSPLLYKVIEDPKPRKNKKATSPTKDAGSVPGSPTKAIKNGLIVKIRRVRQSELSLLNDEAENFMFPKKDDSSEEDTDEDRQTSSEACPADYSQDIPSSDYDHRNSSMRKSAGTPGPITPAARKRTPGRPPADSPSKKQAKESVDLRETATTPVGRSRRMNRVAALLHDNAEYYKFPDPGSRLRFPEAPIQPDPELDEVAATPEAAAGPKKRERKGFRGPAKTPAATATVTSGSVGILDKQQQDLLLATRSSPGSPYHHQEQLSNCGKNIINYVKGKEDGMGVFKWSTFNQNCKQIEPFRFAFERVPSLEPWFETFQRQDESSEKMYEYFGNTAYRKLPYEMGALPPLQQNCCILNYRLKSKTPESTVPSSNSSSCSGHAPAAGDSKTSNNTIETGEKGPLSLPLKKRKLLVDSDRPRKSPREHASTLAILSLLHHQQHNRRRTFSGGSIGSGFPIVTTNLPPPSPVYSPKKAAIQQQQQEADSALGDEIRSSCGSDPVTEKDEPPPPSDSAKKIKFDPPVLEDNFVNYKVMCQELESFLANEDVGGLAKLGEDLNISAKAAVLVPASITEPIKRDLVGIVRACDKEPPLSLKLVSRHESIVRKIVQYDRRPRPLSAIPIKSFDGSGSGGGGGFGGGSLGIFRKRINRTGWPNVKKRIVTRKQQQMLKVKKDNGEGSPEVKKEEAGGSSEVDASRKSSTEESQVSVCTADAAEEGEEVKNEMGEEDEEEDDDEDEFEDTMTMLDDDEQTRNEKDEQVETEDEEEPETPQKTEPEGMQSLRLSPVNTPEVDSLPDTRHTPEPNRTEEILIPSRPNVRPFPSSKYVTKTSTKMIRVDYDAPATPVEDQPLPIHVSAGTSSINVVGSIRSKLGTTTVATADDEDKECDSISSRSIFVSDDCDTTSSTLINMCVEDPLALPSTPQPTALPDEPPERPMSRAARLNSSARQVKRPSSSTLQPVVCIEKLSCSAMRTRSSSRTRTPVKTYKRSVFTSALVNSSGKPLKKKRKKKLKLNGNGNTSPVSTVGGSSSPTCSEDQNSAVSSLECDPIEESATRRAIRARPPTPGPAKFSPRKLRKPRGRWYRER